MIEEVTENTKVRKGDKFYTPDNLEATILELLPDNYFRYTIDIWKLKWYTKKYGITENTTAVASVRDWLDSVLERAPRTYKQIFMDKL